MDMDDTMTRIPNEVHEWARAESFKKKIPVGQFIAAILREHRGDRRVVDRDREVLLHAARGLSKAKMTLLTRFLTVLADVPDEPVILRGFRQVIDVWATVIRNRE
jgi:hypothetical protein